MLTQTAKRYYYDDQRIALQTSVSSGGTEADFRYFVYGNYIDEVLMMRRIAPAADLYYGHDHLYSPVVLFAYNSQQLSWNPTERYEYDAYGKVTIWDAGFTATRSVSSVFLANPFAFTGRELDCFDSNTFRLMYYRARSYDPQTGRFLQRDPLQYVDGMNLYEYGKSNSMIYVDADGNVAVLACPAAAALSAAEIAAIAAAACGVIPDCRAAVVEAISGAISYVGGAIDACCKTRCRLGNHGPDHSFTKFRFGIPPWKKCYMNHIQVNCWRIGVSGSGFALRIPYGPCYKFRGGQGGTTH